MKKFFLFITVLLLGFLVGCKRNELKDFVYEKKEDGIIVKSIKENAHIKNGNIVIPTSVSEVYSTVLFDFNVSCVTLPKTLKRISWTGSHSKDLYYLYYDGLLEDWFNIEMNLLNNNPEKKIKNFYYQDDSGAFSLNNKKYSLLEKLIVPDSIKEIGMHQFACIQSLKSVSISNSVSKIDDYAFFGCNLILFVDLGNNVEQIGDYAFRYCPSIDYLFIPSKRIQFGDLPFDFHGSIYFRGNVEDWVNLSFGRAPFFESYSLWFLDLKSEERQYYLVKDLIIPESITSISDNQFFNSGYIKNISLPKTINKIGTNAFYGCVGSKYYYDGTIEDWLKIDFSPNGNPKNVAGTEIRFLDDSGIIEYNGKHYSSDFQVVIPNTILTIKQYAFSGFEFVAPIYIPKTVSKIEVGAFSQCERLDTILYEGSEEEWKNIEIEAYNDSLENATIIYNS